MITGVVGHLRGRMLAARRDEQIRLRQRRLRQLVRRRAVLGGIGVLFVAAGAANPTPGGVVAICIGAALLLAAWATSRAMAHERAVPLPPVVKVPPLAPARLPRDPLARRARIAIARLQELIPAGSVYQQRLAELVDGTLEQLAVLSSDPATAKERPRPSALRLYEQQVVGLERLEHALSAFLGAPRPTGLATYGPTVASLRDIAEAAGEFEAHTAGLAAANPWRTNR